MLSILIPTVDGREAQFERLCNEITRQHTLLPEDMQPLLKVNFFKDNKEMSIGVKRQLLLDQCETEYFVMIDDDDMISSDFIYKVLKTLEGKPDCITYLEEVVMNGVRQVACHTNEVGDWGNKYGQYDYVRTPFYKDVIKTSIAKQINFSDLRYGEDHDFARRLKASRLIQIEYHIKELMYFYTGSTLTAKEMKKRYGIK